MTSAVESAPRNYTFREIATCNMCGCASSEAQVLGVRLDKSQGRNPRNRTGIAVTICRCRKCYLVYANPQPVPRHISDHYGLPPESYWKTVDVDPPGGYFQRELETVCKLLNFRPGMKAIDVGIGLGKEARVMRDAGFDVYGFEPSEPFFRKAVELLGTDGDRFQLATIEDAEFENGQFDFVSFGAVLEHLYDPSAALAKAMGWLKPGGIVYGEIPNSRHLVSKLLNAYYRISGTSFVTNTSPMHVPFHLYEFSLDSFRLNGLRNGYDVALHWVDVASIYNIPRFLHPLLRMLMSRNETGMQLTVFLRKK